MVAAPALTRAVVQAIRVGLTMASDVDVVHVTADLAEGERFRERIERQVPNAAVVTVESPYRSLVKPFVRYLQVSQAEHPAGVTIVLIPEFVSPPLVGTLPVQPELAPHPRCPRRAAGHRGP